MLWRLLRRQPRLPSGVRPGLERDERVLAFAVAEPGPEQGTEPAVAPGTEPEPGPALVVATTRGLWLPAHGRLGWHEIHKVVWSGRALTVTPAVAVEERAGYRVVADGAPVCHLLPTPGELPDQVRGRVTRSVGHTAHHVLPGGGGLRVVARRVPGVDGLTWTVRYDPGTDGASAEARAVTDALVAQARRPPADG